MDIKYTIIGTLALMAVGTGAIAMLSNSHEPSDEQDEIIEDSVETEENTEEETLSEEEEETEEETEPTEDNCEPEPLPLHLNTGGDTFTIAAWNPDEVTVLLANWLGMDTNEVRNAVNTNKIDGVKCVVFNVGGYCASEYYDSMFIQGDDLDVYFAEPDWALQFLDDDSRTAPVSDIGIPEYQFAYMYDYTLEQCVNTNGVLKGIPYIACPGCFAYRTDLAEEYLGVLDKDEMQSRIGNWDNFVSAAKEVSERSGGKASLADSVGGIAQAYFCGRNKPLVIDGHLDIDDTAKDFESLVRELWDCGGVSKNDQWTDEWYTNIQNGDCMGCFVPVWALQKDTFFIDANCKSYGKWALCSGPQPYSWGGNMLVVNPYTDNGEEVRDFITSAIYEENMFKFASQSSSMPNNINVVQQLIENNFAYDDVTSGNIGGQNYLEILDGNAKELNLKGLITPYDSTIQSDLTSSLSYCLSRKSDFDEELDLIKEDLALNYPELEIN